MGPACDVCLEPDLEGGVLLPAGLLSTVVCIDCLAFTAAAGIGLADAADLLERFRVNEPHPDLFAPDADAAPGLAATAIRPPRPDSPPDPAANEVRLFQWPPHCGQWFALAGSPGHPRSVQYGGCRTPAECLEGLSRNLAARGYTWDGGYEPAQPSARPEER